MKQKCRILTGKICGSVGDEIKLVEETPATKIVSQSTGSSSDHFNRVIESARQHSGIKQPDKKKKKQNHKEKPLPKRKSPVKKLLKIFKHVQITKIWYIILSVNNKKHPQAKNRQQTVNRLAP